MLAVLRNGVPLTSATSTRTADPATTASTASCGRLQADVPGEVVERAGGDHRQRQAVLERDGGRGGDAAVAAGHTERLGPPGPRRLAEQLGDAGLLAQLQHLGAGEQAGDVGGRVVVVGARARVDGDHQPGAVGQRRGLGRRPDAGRVLGPDPPPVLGGGGDRAAHGEAGQHVARVVHADVHARVADAQRDRRERDAGERALHRHAGDERRPPTPSARSGTTASRGSGAAAGRRVGRPSSGRTRLKNRLRTALTSALETAIEPSPRTAPRRSGPLRSPNSAPTTIQSLPWSAQRESRRSQRSAGEAGRAPTSACSRLSQCRGEGTR